MASRVAAAMTIPFLVSASLAVPTPASGQAVSVQFYPPDARSQGMAGAFTAIADGPAVNWWNPGALAFQTSIRANPFSYVQLVPDLADDVKLHTFGGAWSPGGFGVGAHLTRINYGENTLRDRNGMVLGTYEPTENVVLIGGGVDIGRSLGGEGDRLQLGVGGNLRLIDSNLLPAWASPFGFSGEATSWDADLGSLLVYRILIDAAATGGPEHISHLNLRGGIVINNLFDRRITYEPDEEGDPLDRQLRLGAAAEFELAELPPFEHLFKATVSIDQVRGIAGTSEAVERFGTELSFLGLFAVRAGYLHEGDAYGECCSFNDWSWGFGVGADLELEGLPRFGGRFDYARMVTAPEFTRPKMYSVSGWLTF